MLVVGCVMLDELKASEAMSSEAASSRESGSISPVSCGAETVMEGRLLLLLLARRNVS